MGLTHEWIKALTLRLSASAGSESRINLVWTKSVDIFSNVKRGWRVGAGHEELFARRVARLLQREFS